MKFKTPAIITAIIALSLTLSDAVNSFAQDPQNTVTNPTGLYEKIQSAILLNVGNITTFILIPVGVLMIIINILLILWSLVAGEKGNVGGRIGGIILGFVLVVIAIAINASRNSLFQTNTVS